MNKIEFDEKYKLIHALRKQNAELRTEINEKIKLTPSVCSQMLTSIQTRDASFDKYTSLLSEFQFDEDELAPLDQFPGITTSKKIIDPELLSKKTEEMKKEAFAVKNEAQKAEAYKDHGIQDLKRLLNLVIEYSIQADQIYDLELELLQDLDSVYDVGLLAQSTK